MLKQLAAQQQTFKPRKSSAGRRRRKHVHSSRNIPLERGTVTSVGGINIYGAGKAGCSGYSGYVQNQAQTILHQDMTAPFPTMIVVNGANHKPFKISGIQFEGTVDPTNDNVVGIGV